MNDYGPHVEPTVQPMMTATLGSLPRGPGRGKYGPLREIVVPIPDRILAQRRTINTRAHEAARARREAGE